ncbi:adenylate/guanylate cyclase domain-containing protein [Variovorax sp. LjRoot84]|uniref:adenylate/guanylate cyclase domain-containing protein n=2 Tax=unclassified Variovorax TaxID=663243 RepID=UPI003ED0841B
MVSIAPDMPTTMRAGARRRVDLLRRALRWGAVIGAVVGSTSGYGFPDAPLFGASFGALAGATHGVLLAGAIFGAEIFLPPTRLGHTLERAPFLVSFAMKLLVYGAVIVLVIGARPGWQLAGAIAAILPNPELAAAISVKIATPRAPSVALAFLILGAGIFLLQMGRLVGEQTLRDIVLGRYHRPRTEERFFLFVDIVGSTPLAERIGPDAVHRFLGEVFRLASDLIDDHLGEVYQYVGDEIVITWAVAEGREGARPVACYFAIEQALARAAPEFEREFGAVPRLRAALHGGPVITGEVGGSRRAIVYHGDVVNTTSRIEQATRDLERQFLVSGDALERLEDLEGCALEDLGLQQLRGRAAAMQVYAVRAKASTNSQ